MYLIKTPALMRTLAPGMLWRVETNEREIYLTFDDGPVPEVTPWVLDILAQYNAKATFFCVGDNARKYPEIYRRILREGHQVGNHTFNHLKGCHTDLQSYLNNVKRCAEWVQSDFFRPPYGLLSTRQKRALQRDYQIVMWDVLSGDFDPKLSPRQCLRNVLDHAAPGSIVVFHDNVKALPRLRYALPETLSRLSAYGYAFKSLPPREQHTAALSPTHVSLPY